MKTAGEIKVGDVVEFEVGSPVRVTEISDNHGPDKFGPGGFRPDSDWTDRAWGRSLCFFGEFLAGDIPTAYVRRERSPISGRVVR